MRLPGAHPHLPQKEALRDPSKHCTREPLGAGQPVPHVGASLCYRVSPCGTTSGDPAGAKGHRQPPPQRDRARPMETAHPAMRQLTKPLARAEGHMRERQCHLKLKGDVLWSHSLTNFQDHEDQSFSRGPLAGGRLSAQPWGKAKLRSPWPLHTWRPAGSQQSPERLLSNCVFSGGTTPPESASSKHAREAWACIPGFGNSPSPLHLPDSLGPAARAQDHQFIEAGVISEASGQP